MNKSDQWKKFREDLQWFSGRQPFAHAFFLFFFTFTFNSMWTQAWWFCYPPAHVKSFGELFLQSLSFTAVFQVLFLRQRERRRLTEREDKPVSEPAR